MEHPRAGSLGHSEKPREEDTLAQEVDSFIDQILLWGRRWGYREKDSLILHRVQSSRKIAHNTDSQGSKRKSKARERRQHLGTGWTGKGYQHLPGGSMKGTGPRVQEGHPGWRSQLVITRDSLISHAKCFTFCPQSNKEPLTDFKEGSDMILRAF